MSFIFPLLRSSDPTRHQKAVSRLADGSLTVTVTKQTNEALWATVTSRDHVYGVHLAGGGGRCDCADATWRGLTCIHQLATAISFLQPKPEPVAIETTHLQWRSGDLLCQEPHPLRVWTWPWPMGILAHQAQWPEVSLCQTCLQTWTHPTGLEALKEAA